MNDNRTHVHCERHLNNIQTDPNITPPLGSAQPSALLVHSERTGAVGQVSFWFPRRLKHRIPTPLDKILRTTTPTRAMIKDVFNFVLARLISSRTENWYVSFVGMRAIVANSGLELRGMKHVMNTPLARQLKAERHSADSSNDTKRSNKLSSEFSRQPRCKLEMLSRQPCIATNDNVGRPATPICVLCHRHSSARNRITY